jgi:hypothetical protein
VCHLQATVDNDLPQPENAGKALAAGLPAEEPTGQDPPAESQA